MSCESHDADFARAGPAATKTFVIPAAQAASGLMSQPAPGELDGDRSDVSIARLVDALFSTDVTTLVVCRRQPSGGAHFFAVPKLAPAEEFVHIHPRRVLSDSPKL